MILVNKNQIVAHSPSSFKRAEKKLFTDYRSRIVAENLRKEK